MAYQGTRTVAQRHYRDKYLPGIGTVPSVAGIVEAEWHCYQCEHCGKTYQFPEIATEPFYCNSHACQSVKLVSIEE